MVCRRSARRGDGLVRCEVSGEGDGLDAASVRGESISGVSISGESISGESISGVSISGVPGIEDPGRLGRWISARGGDLGQLRRVELIAGGRSNLTYRLDTSAGPVVLRRPPLGHVLPTAHDMSREYRVLSALRGTNVPVPAPVAICADTEVIGAPFYLMQYVDGLVLRTREDGAQLIGEQAGQLSAALAEMLARIHAVDTAAVGLTGFGRPDGYLARQLARWQRQWELSTTRVMPRYDELVRRLAAGLPGAGEGTLVHGDFRLDNTLVTLGAQPAIAAVVDWEMCTLGDPLADLGLTLSYWADPDDADWRKLNVGATVTALPGFFSAEQFAARYAELTGRDVSGMGYYMAFGCFKLAVVLEGINARFLQHQTVGAGFEHEGRAVAALIERAHRMLDRSPLT
jgi:aminoglycoside phosphotransferase (APT) family kinase protein